MLILSYPLPSSSHSQIYFLPSCLSQRKTFPTSSFKLLPHKLCPFSWIIIIFLSTGFYLEAHKCAQVLKQKQTKAKKICFQIHHLLCPSQSATFPLRNTTPTHRVHTLMIPMCVTIIPPSPEHCYIFPAVSS